MVAPYNMQVRKLQRLLPDGARVGSNAVVIKEVPPGATAVGNPARILHKEVDAARETAANRMGFSAYGISQDGDDPLVKALHGLIDHADQQRRHDRRHQR